MGCRLYFIIGGAPKVITLFPNCPISLALSPSGTRGAARSQQPPVPCVLLLRRQRNEALLQTLVASHEAPQGICLDQDDRKGTCILWWIGRCGVPGKETSNACEGGVCGGHRCQHLLCRREELEGVGRQRMPREVGGHWDLALGAPGQAKLCVEVRKDLHEAQVMQCRAGCRRCCKGHIGSAVDVRVGAVTARGGQP